MWFRRVRWLHYRGGFAPFPPFFSSAAISEVYLSSPEGVEQGHYMCRDCCTLKKIQGYVQLLD